MSKRVTIKSIADDLGISHMTVSRALSEHPNVQKETRDAVRRRARELGYVPSAAARAMRGDKSAIVGLLVPNISNDFYARFANAFAEACGEQGLQVIIHLTDDAFDAEADAMRRLREIQARAAVVVPAPSPRPIPARADPPGLDLVHLIRQRPGAGEGAAILVEDAPAIAEAVQHLAALGHRRIAYIGAPKNLSSGRARLAAYQDGLAQAGLNVDERRVFTDKPSFAMGYRMMQRVLVQREATAVLCGGFEISNGALKAAMEAQALEADLAFVGYGDPDFYSWVAGGLTTVAVPVDELAHCAAKVVSRQGEAARDAGAFGFEAKLVVRDQTARGANA
ncbi:MAG: LacI family DNA-binding transcriptional regulator [Pseudomonadota bacterium]